jgi:hypothetical protein
MKITNTSLTDAIQITDLLSSDSSISQWQDGLRNLLIPANDYRIVPNLQGCNSPSVKALLTSGAVTVDRTVEPTGAEPTKEVGGPIVGHPNVGA